ncbi:hypothetical protein, partial [Klebsiella variicola]|uniref:hypothetical protein n=1 Tax=Klebsiella variicola TaxID=244366 RepID=UPI002480288B
MIVSVMLVPVCNGRKIEVRARKAPLLRALSSQDGPSGEGIFGLAGMLHRLVTTGFFQVRVHKS